MKRATTSNLLFFKSKTPHVIQHNGLKSKIQGYYHPWKEFNMFEKSPVKIPKNFKRIKAPKTSWIKKYIANPNSYRILKPLNFIPYQNELYEIRDNRSTPYIVYVNSDRTTVYIYRIPKKGYVINKDWSANNADNYGYFTELVKEYKNVKEVIPGIDYKEGMKGNSVLIRLDKTTYVYIGDSIYSFSSDEHITQYFSNMGNNLVPYPVGESKSYLYFMLDKVYVAKTEFREFDFTDEMKVADIYGEFYNINKDIKKKRIAHYRLIKKRLI